jgi:N-methylhydantoinase B
LISLPSKGRVDLMAGDILTLYTAGGGGYGAPAEREPALVQKDVAEGIITPATAATFYGRAG